MINRIKQPRILIADDEPESVSLLTMILERHGAIVSGVHDGQAAVTLAMMHPFDIIILDVKMPILNGIEACRQLSELHYTRDVPVLMLTGRSDHECVEMCFAAGAGDYLNKPVYPELLWRRVCNLLELSELKRSANELTVLIELAKSGDAQEAAFEFSPQP